MNSVAGQRREQSRTAAATPLAVRRVTLTAFRNYAAARLDVDPEPVVLVGANGAGKTNLLEAVSLLAPGRGLRGARLADLARRGSAGEPAPALPGWGVAAVLDTPAGAMEIGTGREGETEGPERRSVRIDGRPGRGQSALAEHVAAVWLTPQMDRLFLEGPSERRRFLDRLVYGFDPAHAGRVSAYENAMRQRARLLRDGPGDPAWLGALEAQMAARAVAIAAARLDTVRRLDQAAALGVGPFPSASVAVSGTVEAWLGELPALAAEERLAERLAASRAEDAAAGTTAIGAHRSDLVVHMRQGPGERQSPGERAGMPAAQGSTGEQKALLIAIVLASARLVAAVRGAAPLLLLDEVAAHLDPARRAALFDEIAALGAQAWLTGTDAETFAPLAGRARFVRVADGRLSLL